MTAANTLLKSAASDAKASARTSLLKLTFALYLPVIIALSGLAYAMMKFDIDTRMKKLQTQESAEIYAAEQLLTYEIGYAISDLRLLAQTPSLQRYVNEGSPAEKQRATQHFMNMAGTKLRYDQIRYLDNNGKEKIRINLINNKAVVVPERELQNKSGRYFFHDTLILNPGDIYASPLDLNIEHGQIETPVKPMLRFSTPLFNLACKKQGILILNYQAQKLLDNFAHAMGDKRHSILLNKDGFWLSSPDKKREWGFMYNQDDTFGKDHPVAWSTISTNQKGSMLFNEGLYTFATIHPLPSQPLHSQRPFNPATAKHAGNPVASDYYWKIVSLVPADELPALSPGQYHRSFILFGLGAALLYMLAHYLASNILNRRQLLATIYENDAQLKEITSTMGQGIYVVDKHGLTTFINPEAERLLGWTQAELAGKNAHNFFHYRNLDGTTIPARDCEIYQVMKSGKAYRSNSQIFWRKDGSCIYVDVSASPIVRDGKIMGAVVAFNDISKQKQDEAALHHRSTQLKLAQRLAQLGSWELDLTSGELTWSDEIYRIFEIDPGAFSASYEAFLNIIHPQDRELVNLAFKDSVQQHIPYNTEHRLQFADGRIKYVIERGETFYDADNRPIRSIGTVQDITERKIAQEALRTSKETARALLNATSESAILMDAQGNVLAINKIASTRLRKRTNEILGHNLFEFFPPDVAANRKIAIEKILHSGQPGQFQDECNGLHFDQRIYPILDEQGKLSQIAIYSTDITERIKFQAEETLLHRIDQQVLRSNSLPGLLQFICDEIVQLFDYQFTWLGKKEAGGAFSISAQSGQSALYLQDLLRIGVRWDDTSQGQGPAGNCVRSGHLQIFKISDQSFLPWRDAAMRYDFESIAGIPLKVRGQVYGVLMLYSRLEQDFDDLQTQQRLSAISSRICVALEMAMDQEQLRLLSSALASAGNGVFITNAQGLIQWVNNAFTILTGYSSDESIGKYPSLLNSGKQDIAYYKILWDTIKQGKNWSSETIERHKNGSLFTVQQSITPIKDEKGEISHFVSILDDITSQKKIAEHIHYLAHYDALTNLPNRTLFRDRLRQNLAQAKRDGYNSALMFIDLDRFKIVNDTLGHHIGDLLLQAVADRLRDCVRASDTISRLAGDEFTVLLPNIHGRDDAAQVAEKITAALAEPFLLDGHVANIGSSTGIAFYPADANSDEALIKCADQAMYTAKEQGRGTFRFYQPPGDKTV